MDRITTEEYATAVINCVRLARQGTGGGRVAAQALLSAYNGNAFQLDVADLCTLDTGNFEHVMRLIRGRYELNLEPHKVVENGSKIFSSLWDQWSRFHLEERAKRECPSCDGRGKVYINTRDEDDMSSEPCARCSGTGRVCRCQ